MEKTQAREGQAMNDSGGGLSSQELYRQFQAARFPSSVEGATMEWVVPYGRIATRLLPFSKNRGVPCRIANEFLERERLSGGPLEDLGPFTFFGLFNGKVRTDEKRADCVGLVFERLGITLPVPHDFQGAPHLNPRHWRFADDAPGAIEAEWACFEAALALADEEDETEESRDRLCEAFDRALGFKGLGSSNLPIALYWARPNRYLALDALMDAHLASAYGISVPKDLDGAGYLDLVDEVAVALAEGEGPARTFPDLCVLAWREHAEALKADRA